MRIFPVSVDQDRGTAWLGSQRRSIAFAGVFARAALLQLKSEADLQDCPAKQTLREPANLVCAQSLAAARPLFQQIPSGTSRRPIVIYNRIRAFVERLTPDLVCDRCVVERLGLHQELTPGLVLHELATQPRFERQVGQCALCGDSTQAIRRKGR